MNRTEILNLQSPVRGGYSVLSCLVAKPSRAHENSAVTAAPSGTGATLDSSSTPTPVVAVANSSSTAVCCSCAVVAAKSEVNKIFAAENTTIRVGV